MQAILFACLFLFHLLKPAGIQPIDSQPEWYSGWAAEAYPELSAAQMKAMVARMVAAGANVIWIGHNNPGEVQPGKVEPGLSYAVYHAFLNPADPNHQSAVNIVQAQQRMLDACRAVGIKAVLPVGYQMQMGQAWNSAHPLDLRTDANGKPLDIFGGGVSATCYAPSYRQAMAAYYRWVDVKFVQPNNDVLLMLNLADEPIGGDYSVHAEAQFRARHGFGFAEVGHDPERQRLLGAFQSRYVVECAAQSAALWQEIHPGLPVTMSFDGAQARSTFTMPDVEGLFRDTPANFVVTLDAYPHDGLPNTPMSDKDLVELFLLARSLGIYSARFGKPVWLWAAANSWGLSQASPEPGTISDAVANGLYLALLVRQAGGTLQGIAYWNYNVKGQGLYNDTHRTSYDPDAMFFRVSAALPTLRRLMAARPGELDVLILAPSAVAHQQIGATREPVRLEVQPYGKLAALARPGLNAAVVGELSGWQLQGLRAIVVLSPAPDYLTGEDLAALSRFLQAGGRVVASAAVSAALAGQTPRAPTQAFGELVERSGTLYSARSGVAILFEDSRHEILAPFWREVLGISALEPPYQVTTQQVTLYYNPGPLPAKMQIQLQPADWGYRYDDQARPVESIQGSCQAVELGRREYALIWHLPQPTGSAPSPEPLPHRRRAPCAVL